MSVILFEHVEREYRIKESGEGIKNAIGSFVHPKYRTVQAVQNISFNIDAGRTLGLIGENGAGKTTIIKLICGILAPDAGRIEVLGINPFSKSPDFKRNISLLLGNKNQLWWDLPAHESFLITKKLYGLSTQEYRASLEELVSVLGISDFINSPIKNLSLGQRMRCELVNALLHKPAVILLDEPTLGLDLKSQIMIRNYIQQYVTKNNATCVITSHNIKDITSISTDVVILHNGHLIHTSTTMDFLKKCAGFSIIEIDGMNCEEIRITIDINCYEHNSMNRVLVPTEDVSEIMSRLVQHKSCKSVKVLEASVDDLVENQVLSIQDSN
jgi:ABC-2 type transport system ATP-binding protein